jgi:hypothetical protein
VPAKLASIAVSWSLRGAMNHLLREALRALAQSGGYYAGGATSRTDLLGLIERLRPVPINEPLSRFGPAQDGGYLMPDDLVGVRACLSPGVSTECGFDSSIASRGIDVFMADASVAGVPANDKFHFIQKFVGSHSAKDTISINDFFAWADSLTNNGVDLAMQMDIEGAEYTTLLALEERYLRRLRVLVVEFHDLQRLGDAFAFRFMADVFAKLLVSHAVVHLHPNNVAPPVKLRGVLVPPAMEFTFWRRDRFSVSRTARPIYPHPLDADCCRAEPRVLLPAIWQCASR